MKKLTAVLFIGFFALHASAEERTLKEVMQDLAQNLQEISVQIRGKQFDTETVIDFQELSIEAISLIPEKVSLEPDLEKRQRLRLQYKRLIHSLLEEGLDLEEVYLNGDQDEAISKLKKILEIRNQGHGLFK